MAVMENEAGRLPSSKPTKTSRGDGATRTKERRLKPGPKRAGGTKGPNKGEGASIQLKMDPELFPHIRDLFSVDSPKELEERYGIKLDRDLPWPGKSKKSHSLKAGAILEMIARRLLAKGTLP